MSLSVWFLYFPSLFIYANRRSSQGRRAHHNHTFPPASINRALRVKRPVTAVATSLLA